MNTAPTNEKRKKKRSKTNENNGNPETQAPHYTSFWMKIAQDFWKLNRLFIFHFVNDLFILFLLFIRFVLFSKFSPRTSKLLFGANKWQIVIIITSRWREWIFVLHFHSSIDNKMQIKTLEARALCKWMWWQSADGWTLKIFQKYLSTGASVQN